jgi:molybdenum cofactor cytidylyltransferase
VRDVAGLVLAAGSGRRFAAAGGTGSKLLATVAGRPLLDHVLDLAGTIGLTPVTVVIPPDAAALQPLLAARPWVGSVTNPDAATGMRTSVAVGLRALEALVASDAHGAAELGACVVLLGDQPSVAPDVVQQVIATWRTTGRPVRVRYSDGPGHPVLLPREHWSTIRAGLQAAPIDEGARGMLAGLGAVDVDVAGPAPTDVDVPADLDRVDRPPVRDPEGTADAPDTR